LSPRLGASMPLKINKNEQEVRKLQPSKVGGLFLQNKSRWNGS